MNLNDLEKRLQQASENSDFTFNEQDWKEAYQMIQPRKKRKPFWLLLLLPLIGYGLLVGLNHQHENKIPQDSLSTEKSDKDLLISENKIPQEENTPSENITKITPKNTSSKISTISTSTKTKAIQKFNIASHSLSNRTSDFSSQEIIGTTTSSQGNIINDRLPVFEFPVIKNPMAQSIQFAEENTLKGEDVETITPYYKKYDWSVRLGQGMAAYQTPHFSTEIGIELFRYFRNGVFISVLPGIGFTYGPEQLSSIITIPQYGVEVKEDHFGIHVGSRADVHLPIDLGLQFNRWRISIGYGFQIPILASGHIDRMKLDDDEWVKDSPLGDGQLNLDFFQHFAHGPRLNAQYMFLPGHEIGIQLRSMLTPIIKSPISHADGMDLTFGITYNYYIQ